MAEERDQQIKKSFGRRLKKLRKEKGFSLRGFALECDLDHSTIVRLEKGEMNPSMTTLIYIAEALGIEPGELFK